MQTLKLKSISTGFLAILMVSLIMTSCEQAELKDIGAETPIENTSQLALETDVIDFFLPYGYQDKMSEEETRNYVNTLSKEDLEKLALHRKVVYYFMTLEKVGLLDNHASYGDVFDENTIAEFLSEEETLVFKTFNVESLIALRGCGPWRNVGSPHEIGAYVSNPPNPPTFICFVRTQLQVRNCTGGWWNGNTPYIDHRTVYSGC